jgi:acyl carrier protein
MPDELARKVISVIAKTQRMPSERISLDSTFAELGIDSLDGINILFALENEFDINIPDEAARNVRTVRQMVEGVGQLVTAKQAEGGPAAQA